MLDFTPQEMEILMAMGIALVGLLVITFALSFARPRGFRNDAVGTRNGTQSENARTAYQEWER